jgi:hypothetical protein
MASLNEAYKLQFADNEPTCFQKFTNGLYYYLTCQCCFLKRVQTFEELNILRNNNIYRNLDNETKKKFTNEWEFII